MTRNTTLTTFGLFAVFAGASALPAMANPWDNGNLQNNKNNARNLAIGGAAVAAYGLLTHNSTATLLGAAGAALAGSQYERDSQIQSQDNGRFYDRNNYGNGGYDRNGYNRDGFNHDGFNHDGFNHDGFNHDGFNHDGFNRSGYDHDGFDQNGYNRNGDDRSDSDWNRGDQNRDNQNQQWGSDNRGDR